MPLKKLVQKAGVNRENTRYASENGYYESEKARFRQGTPEKIGGWSRISGNTFLGVCRSMWNWITLGFQNLLGLGTNLKFYIEQGGIYYDVTPIRTTTVLTNPFTATNGSPLITVSATAHGCVNGDFVTYSGATGLGGNISASVLNAEHQIAFVSANSYTFNAGVNANTFDTGNGGTVTAVYQINVGPSYAVPQTGWGAGPWGGGTWGIGGTSADPMRLWSQSNFGENLIFGPRGGGIYYWTTAGGGLLSRGVLVSSLGGTVTVSSGTPAVVTYASPPVENTAIQFAATGSLPTGITAGTTYYAINVTGFTSNLTLTAGGSLVATSSTGSGVYISLLVDVPIYQNYLLISDASRFVFAFGANSYGSTTQNPMLVRWSDQESITDWAPSAVNQAGEAILSHGSRIVTALQTRQEILVFTDSTLYSLQYAGAPIVWGTQLLGDNISIAGPNAAALASGITYWMGVDKFYKYDGRVQTLSCDLRQYIYGDINLQQAEQFFASTNEGFNEVWFFYCSQDSVKIDKYVIYNYLENVWSYGAMRRSAWLDSGLRNYPMAATYPDTELNNIVYHEYGVDDNATDVTAPIYAMIATSEFDIDDGDRFGFVWRLLPDITFRGSTAGVDPLATMTLIPLRNSGSGANTPESVGGSSNATIIRTAVAPIEEFTGQVYVRVRGRQMILKLESNQIGTTWQMGSFRIDVRLDGRR